MAVRYYPSDSIADREIEVRAWFKYLVDYDESRKVAMVDATFEEHKKSMGGYACGKEYETKEAFFKFYLKGTYRRHVLYHDYLLKNLKKGERVLSLGSGRCADELYFIDNGFDILCSDLEQPCREETLRLFPGMKFRKLDILVDDINDKFDCIMCLGVLCLFDEKTLKAVFKKIHDAIVPGGTFIFDMGGAEDSLATKILDEVICKAEASLVNGLKKINKKEKYVLTKKQHGYRYTNKDIKRLAGDVGFELLSLSRDDYITELERSRLFQRLPSTVVRTLGRQVPYMRIFKFKRAICQK